MMSKFMRGWKPTPVKVHIVFRAYAAIVGTAGIALLLGESTMVREFGALSLAAALWATGLSFVPEAQMRNRSLFWFAMGHAGLWLVLVWTRLGGPAIGGAGGVAFLLFCFWLLGEGELPPAGAVLFEPPASRPGEPLRSAYERKIRQAAAQEERNRLARDLHDSIKQQIFASQTAAATAQTRFDGDAHGAREALDQIRSAAREAMTEMEVMLDQLRAEPLESTGLVAALKKLCESIGFRTGAEVEFKLGSLPASSLSAP